MTRVNIIRKPERRVYTYVVHRVHVRHDVVYTERECFAGLGASYTEIGFQDHGVGLG